MKRLLLALVVILTCAYARAQTADTLNSAKDTITLTKKQKQLKETVAALEDAYFQKNYDQTIRLSEYGIQLAKELDSIKNIISISSFLGNALLQIKDTVSAKNVFEENLLRARKLDNAKQISTAKIDLANMFALQKKYEPAIKLYKENIPFAEKNRDSSSLFILHSNIAELSLDQNNASVARYHVAKMNGHLQNLNNSNLPYFRAGGKLLTGRLRYLENEYGLAIEELEEGVRLAEEINFNEILIQLYDYLSQAQRAAGQYEAALSSREKYEEYQEAKYEEDKILAIESATAEYKVNQYQQELTKQALQAELDKQETKRKTQLFWSLIASGILLVFLIFLIFTFIRRQRLLKNLKIKNKQYLEEKEKTEELSKAKTKLYSNLTHELRTPMYGIIGVSNILQDGKLYKEQKQHVKTLKFSADYLLSLINNALYFNKIDAEENKKLKKKRFSVRKLVEEVVASSKFLNREHPNDYIVDIDEAIPQYIKGDRTKLAQIFMNLLSNASKFTNDGLIAVTLKRQKTSNADEVKIHFSIQDNGVGIPASQQKEIFEDFVQNVYNSSVIKGTGLGLPIVKQILEQHDANLTLTSERGEGTKVAFTIVYEISKEQNSKKLNGTLHKSALHDKHILIVDDNSINRLVTDREVKRFGGETTVASSGKEALELFSENNFDLVLMDINMPEMDGFETTEEIRKLDKEIPVLALTAVEKEKVLEQHKFNLMNDIVIKPYKGEHFIQTIVKHL